LPQKTAIVAQGNQLAFCLGLSVNLDLQAIWGHIQISEKAISNGQPNERTK
jgi:hypothetical protein